MNLKTDKQKLSNLNKREEKDWKKQMNGVSGDCGTIAKGLGVLEIEEKE